MHAMPKMNGKFGRLLLLVNLVVFLALCYHKTFLSLHNDIETRRWHSAGSLHNSVHRDIEQLTVVSKSKPTWDKTSVQSSSSLSAPNGLSDKMALSLTDSEELKLKFKVTDQSSGDEYQVPNIVHYIWHNAQPAPLRFDHMIGVLSAHKTIRPEAIYFHTSNEPTGPYWQALQKLPGLKVIHRPPPTHVFGEKLPDPHYYTSHSNVDRLLVLMEYGGIYLDLDVIATSPFNELRRHACVIGWESEEKACGSVIVCRKDSPFLRLWINAYLDDYRMEEWAYNTGKVPWKLSRRFPELVHVETKRLNRPNFMELDLLWGTGHFDWRGNYAVHTWYRIWRDKSHFFKGIEPNENNIRTWNTTFGEIVRSVLYGTKRLLDVDG